MSRMNLLAETIRVIEANSANVSDVVWCGCRHFFFTWDEFVEVAKNTEYDNGYGAPAIAQDLIVVGKDWWLERREYDGSEWWEFESITTIPNYHMKPKTLGGDEYMWVHLMQINLDPKDQYSANSISHLEIEQWLDKHADKIDGD